MGILKSGREKKILKQGIIIAVGMAVFYFFVLSPFLREGSSILDEELDRKTNEIKKYISRTGSMPSKDSFYKLKEQEKAMEARLQDLTEFVDPKMTRVSESNSEAGLYFIERLHSSMKKFSQLRANVLQLPENLGFGDGLPKSSMVNVLIRQLEIVEFVVDELLKAEGIEISAIKPLKSIDYIEPLSKEVFYTELPVQVSFKTDTKSFIGLLVKLKNQSPVISVKEVHIKSGDPESQRIETSLVLSAFQIARNKE